MGKWYTNNNSKQREESMSSVNRAIILGRLTRDVETRQTNNGKTVANFAVATSKKWNDKATGEPQEKSEFHNITVFGSQADNASKYLSKGSQVYIEGEIVTDKWQDKDGNNRYTTKINANNITFIGSKPQHNDALQNATNMVAKEFNVSTDSSFASEDLPF